MRCHRRTFLLLPMALLFALGCSGTANNPNAPAMITGEITYKGDKLGGGTITFSSDKGDYAAPIHSDGTYSATDIPTGEMTVTIETGSVAPAKKMPTYGDHKDYLKNMNTMMKDKEDSESKYVKIPDRYSKKSASGLTYTVKSGKQTKSWELD